MRRIIQEYEQRNKVIAAIQKNLRIGRFKKNKSMQKCKNSTSAINCNTLDLPHIHQKNMYSPQGQSEYYKQKKSLSNEIYEVQSPKKTIPYIQTITFQPQNQEQPQSPKIIINNRFTMRNFMRTTQNLTANKQSSQKNDSYIFWTPRKAPNSNKQFPKLQQKISNLQNSLQPYKKKSQSLQIQKNSKKKSEQKIQTRVVENKKNNKISLDQLVSRGDYDTISRRLQENENRQVIAIQQRRKNRFKPRETKPKLLKSNSDRMYAPWDIDVAQGNSQIWQM